MLKELGDPEGIIPYQAAVGAIIEREATAGFQRWSGCRPRRSAPRPRHEWAGSQAVRPGRESGLGGASPGRRVRQPGPHTDPCLTLAIYAGAPTDVDRAAADALGERLLRRERRDTGRGLAQAGSPDVQLTVVAYTGFLVFCFRRS